MFAKAEWTDSIKIRVRRGDGGDFRHKDPRPERRSWIALTLSSRRVALWQPFHRGSNVTAMTAAALVLSARTRIERLFDALVDPARRERTMLVVLACYFAIWSLYATISRSSQDIHTDMGEFIAWSREVGLGTPKHPPLGAWLVRAWFSVFPREDWAYYCLAILLPTVALWITWRLAARYLPPDKRIVGMALLTFVPFYNFHAIKFNANTVLTPFWALATWSFLRSFETRRVGWATFAGIAAAAAMLAKYWSLTLLAGLGVAALSDPRRSAYFSSPAPYVTLALGTVLLTPNIHWLTTHAFMPFSYAMEAHSGTTALALYSALIFIGNSLAYAVAAIVFGVLAVRPSGAAIRDTLWPADVERRTQVIAFAAPFLLAALIAVLLTVAIEFDLGHAGDDAAADRAVIVAAGRGIPLGRRSPASAGHRFSLIHARGLASGRARPCFARRAESRQRLPCRRPGGRARLARAYGHSTAHHRRQRFRKRHRFLLQGSAVNARYWQSEADAVG